MRHQRKLSSRSSTWQAFRSEGSTWRQRGALIGRVVICPRIIHAGLNRPSLARRPCRVDTLNSEERERDADDDGRTRLDDGNGHVLLSDSEAHATAATHFAKRSRFKEQLASPALGSLARPCNHLEPIAGRRPYVAEVRIVSLAARASEGHRMLQSRDSLEFARRPRERSDAAEQHSIPFGRRLPPFAWPRRTTAPRQTADFGSAPRHVARTMLRPAEASLDTAAVLGGEQRRVLSRMAGSDGHQSKPSAFSLR